MNSSQNHMSDEPVPTETKQPLDAGERDVKIDWNNLTQEQKALMDLQLPTLDGTSQMDFVAGFKNYLGRIGSSPAFVKDMDDFLADRNIDPTHETPLGYRGAFETLMEHPRYAAYTRLTASSQHLMWDRARRAFARESDRWMEAMQQTDSAGPGRLELNPNLQIPDYLRHEIHAQPGGFVGNELGGWLYHYAVTLGFRHHSVKFDSSVDVKHIKVAQRHTKPADGKVRRILDLGCAVGQSTTAIKMRFPDAEVWGIDVGGPLVRFGHHRAVGMGIDVNFRQALAEDTGFPDGYFDMVADHIIFHEVTPAAAREIVAEIHRVLRPGGVFNHVDVGSADNETLPQAKTVLEQAELWNIHRHSYYEPWHLDYAQSPFLEVLKTAGFTLDLSQGPGTFETMLSQVTATKSAGE